MRILYIIIILTNITNIKVIKVINIVIVIFKNIIITRNATDSADLRYKNKKTKGVLNYDVAFKHQAYVYICLYYF
jgi:hypothetical protein